MVGLPLGVRALILDTRIHYVVFSARSFLPPPVSLPI